MTWGWIGLAVLAVIAAVIIVRTIHRGLTIGRDARDEWLARSDMDDPLLADVEENQFVAAYRRAYGVRGQLFAIIATIAALASTPLTVGPLNQVWRRIAPSDLPLFESSENSLIQVDPDLFRQFFVFFSVILIWALIAFVFAIIFHRTRSPGLEFELDDIRTSRRA